MLHGVQSKMRLHERIPAVGIVNSSGEDVPRNTVFQHFAIDDGLVGKQHLRRPSFASRKSCKDERQQEGVEEHGQQHLKVYRHLKTGAVLEEGVAAVRDTVPHRGSRFETERKGGAKVNGIGHVSQSAVDLRIFHIHEDVNPCEEEQEGSPNGNKHEKRYAGSQS